MHESVTLSTIPYNFNALVVCKLYFIILTTYCLLPTVWCITSILTSVSGGQRMRGKVTVAMAVRILLLHTPWCLRTEVFIIQSHLSLVLVSLCKLAK